MSEFNLADNLPQAVPWELVFGGRRWQVWPVDTMAIAAQLERWVIQAARRNVEKLKPAPGEEDATAWEVYRDDRQRVGDDIAAGHYGAMGRRWREMLHMTDEGFAEAMYQCIRYKCDDWTREHVKRFMADSPRYDAFFAEWMERNFPKAKPRPEQPGTPTSAPSNGENSSASPSPGWSSPKKV